MLRFKFLSFGLRLARTTAPPHWCVCPLTLCLDRVEYAAGGIITSGGYPGTPRRYHHVWWLYRCTTEVSSHLVAIQNTTEVSSRLVDIQEHHGGIITPGGYPGTPRRYHHAWWISKYSFFSLYNKVYIIKTQKLK